MGILLLGGGFIIRFLTRELKLWQEKYLALVESTVSQAAVQGSVLESLHEAVDDLNASISENKSLQLQVLERLEKVADSLDVKKLLQELDIKKSRPRGTQ